MRGRPVGARNKNKQFLLNRLQEIYGEDFHPIMKMAENAALLQAEVQITPDIATIKAAVDAWDKVAAYTEPKLKSIEVGGDSEKPLITKRVIEFVSSENKNA
jgi:hypothetical protein